MFSLSNLQIQSNLLSTNYQQELSRITVFEARDIERRNPNLNVGARLSSAQSQAWQESLFWGDHQVSLDQNGRSQWFEPLADQVPQAISSFEERPTSEDGFALLVVISQLARSSGYPNQRAAVEWERRVRLVLVRDEFKLNNNMIDQRLSQLVGFQIGRIEQVESPEVEDRLEDVLFSAVADRESFAPRISESDSANLEQPLISHDTVAEHYPQIIDDPELGRLNRRWPQLPMEAKVKILNLLDAVEGLS
jgi:hypothetical protein